MNSPDNIRTCKMNGCANSLNGKRSDAEFCSAKHKSLYHNKIYHDLFKESRKWDKENLRNYRILKDCILRGIFKLTIEDSKIANFNLSHGPLKVMYNGFELVKYFDILLWVDNEKNLIFKKA